MEEKHSSFSYFQMWLFLKSDTKSNKVWATCGKITREDYELNQLARLYFVQIDRDSESQLILHTVLVNVNAFCAIMQMLC